MVDWTLLRKLMLGKAAPPIPNLRLAGGAILPHEGLTMGTLFLGKQGSGKTSFLAWHLLNYLKAFPDRAIFVLDWSGSLSNTLLTLIAQEPWRTREMLIRRFVYDELGHPQWVLPLPEFSHLYGTNYEEQIERVRNNWLKLAQFLAEGATVLGGVAMKGLAPALMRVLVSIGEHDADTWQITEFGRFIDDPSLLPLAFRTYQGRIPRRTREMLTKRLVNVKAFEQELRTYSLTEILSAIEAPAAITHLGYYRPAWTPREAIKNGYMVIINGARLINQKNVQHYLFTQIYSLIMSEINQRQPADPKDLPVSIVLDEVYSLLKIPGMAEEVGMISPIYRSRKVQLYIVIQALWQLDRELAQQIWSLGNAVIFGVENFHEATEAAKQLIYYQPKMVKQEPRADTQNPITEPDHGQYTIHANWIQNVKNRECLIRQYLSESQRDPFLRYVPRTPELPRTTPEEPVERLKERLLRERGVPVHDAFEVVNNRTLKTQGTRRTL